MADSHPKRNAGDDGQHLGGDAIFEPLTRTIIHPILNFRNPLVALAGIGLIVWGIVTLTQSNRDPTPPTDQPPAAT